MGAKSGFTETGGREEGFQRTHWTQVLSVQTGDEAQRRTAVNELLRDYWKPIYCYLRRKGYDNETAKDLAQGFFLDVVLGRDLIQQVDPTKGRFRTFLLTALDRYVVSVSRMERASKRRPEAGLLHLDGILWNSVPEHASMATPEQTFNYAWATALLEGVVAGLERECLASGRKKQWEVFCARVLNPILANEEPVPILSLCSQYAIESERKVWDMVGTMKRRFQAILRSQVRSFVNSEEEVDEEISDLMEILSKKATG